MKLFLLFVVSYLIGNILTGSFISKLFYRREISAEGSGNPGARNVGRLFGKRAFIVTFFGDALKGAIVVFAANWFGFNANIVLLTLFVVILGHIYPVLFKFQGGKGVSTFIGGILAFNPVLILLLIIIFLVFYPINKSFTKSGMIAIMLVPISLFIIYGLVPFIISGVTSGLILFVHRENFKLKRVE